MSAFASSLLRITVHKYEFSNDCYSHVQVLLTTLIGDMGFYSLIIVYGFFGVCSLITSVIIRKIGHKWSLVIGCFTYVVFLAGNIVVNTPLLLIVSAINGIGGALTWSAHGVRVVLFSNGRVNY